jgi:hypothetical protein|tara:strand:- start:48 stop:158 length:111 start_codon:yes stop_codon:yes gene_type:complete
MTVIKLPTREEIEAKFWRLYKEASNLRKKVQQPKEK